MKRSCCGLSQQHHYYYDGMQIFEHHLRQREPGGLLKRFNMKGYSAKLADVLYQLISQLKKALFCLCQGLQSLYCNRDEIRNLLILYITNAIAWVSVYSSYLPTPVKVAWVILSSYYRLAFVVDDTPHKNQEAPL